MPTGETSPNPSARNARRGVLLAVAAVIAVWISYFLLPFTRIGDIRTLLLLVAGAVAIGAIFLWQIRGVLRAEYPVARALEAAVAIFGCYIIGCGTVYYLLSVGDPAGFSEPLTKLDALYFSVTVFATVGFGDIVAMSQTARAVVLAQMIGNLILIGLALRLLTASVQWRRAQLRAGRPSRPTESD
ncbi:potassium channel family protein [Nocardia sp. NPDC057030]|uniref:potassium channel family protein n=1 Tax=unclassified Nocardia TaxID=2637762 RepID=UPI0036305FD8